MVDQMIVIPAAHGFVGEPDTPDTDRGRISVVFLPRLDGARGPRLDSWPGWSVWPNELAQLNLALWVNGINMTGAILDDGLPDPTLPGSDPRSLAETRRFWQAVFPDPSEVEVRAFTFTDPSGGREVETFPEAEAAAALEEISRLLREAHPSEAPRTVGDLRAAVGSLVDDLPFAELRAYMADRPVDPTADERVDFHQGVSQMRRHPLACRRLGLTVEMRVNLTAIRNALPAGTTRWEVQVGTDWASRLGGRAESSPVVLVDADTFWPHVPNDPDIVINDGQMLLGRPEFRLGIGGITTQLTAWEGLVDAEDAEPLHLPAALGNPGLSLYRDGAAQALKDRWKRQQEIETSLVFDPDGNPDLRPDSSVVLTDDDLFGPYRIDVTTTDPADKVDEVLALFARHAPAGYHTANPAYDGVAVPIDEGWIGALIAVSPGQAPRLGESLGGWNGWSLAAPPPSTVFDPVTGEAVEIPANTPPDDATIVFGVDYEVPDATLPRLRYGWRYRWRIRMVDIAGNSIARIDPSRAPIHSNEVFYGRPNPVPGPTILRRSPQVQPPVRGADTLHMVLRSGVTQPDDQIPAQDRMLFPPPAAPDEWILVEQPPDHHLASGYQRLVHADASALADQMVPDPVTGESIAAAVDGRDGVVPGPVAPVADYLRDPAVAGVSLANLPNAGGRVRLDYDAPGAGYPNVLELIARRLVLHAGEKAPEQRTGADAGLHIWLPKAWMLVVPVSSTVRPDLANRFLPGADEQARLVEGTQWTHNGVTRLQIVHAIPNGRFAPTMPDTASFDRAGLESTDATLQADVGVDVPATGTFTFRGRWQDPVDDLAADGPSTAVRRAVLGTATVGYALTATQTGLRVTHEFLDTRRHEVAVQGLATARYTSYFIDPHEVSFDAGDEIVLGEPVVATTFSLRHAGTGQVYAEGTDWTLDPADGRLRRVADGAIVRGEPLVAEYAFGPNTLTTLEGDQPTVVTVVPSSSVPPTPQVTAVQPASRRRQRRRWGAQMLQSDGRILRLRIARPWWVTGAEERLAVVVDGVTPPLTTRYSRDPVQSGVGAGAPSVADFTAADRTLDQLVTTVPGGESRTVSLAGHTPVFDPERGDWVVDVEVHAPGYRPTVRLAIARWQPDSVAGAELSAISLLDPVRLGVTRTMAVRPAVGATAAAPVAQVVVTGEDHAGRLAADGVTLRFNVVRVTVQEADPAIDDPDLRWRSTASVVELARTAGTDDTTWLGEVVLPPALGPLRLLVEELEPVVRTDPASSAGVDDLEVIAVETIALPEGVTGGR